VPWAERELVLSSREPNSINLGVVGCFDERVDSVRVYEVVVWILNDQSRGGQAVKVPKNRGAKLYHAHRASDRMVGETISRQDEPRLVGAIFWANAEGVDDRLGELREDAQACLVKPPAESKRWREHNESGDRARLIECHAQGEERSKR
jgi:hypothetical protein